MKYFLRFYTITLITCVSIVMLSCSGRITTKAGDIYTNVNIPDGEFLRYGLYMPAGKHADMYVVTEKIIDEKRGYVYKSYIDLINVADQRLPDKNYTNWPSYSIYEPKLGRVIESLGFIPTNVLDVVAGWEGVCFWHVKMDPEEGKGEYVVKVIKGNRTNDIKGIVNRYNSELPSVDHWGTFFMQSRFVNYQSGGYLEVINPVFLSVPFIFTYKTEKKMTLETKAGAFNVIKYGTDFFDQIRMTPENLYLILKLMPSVIKGSKDGAKTPNEPFAFYVDDSDKHYTIEIVSPGGSSCNYVLEAISNARYSGK